MERFVAFHRTLLKMRENRVSSCRMIGRILPAMGMGIQSGQMPGKINPHHNGQIEGEHPPEQDRNAHTARCLEEHLKEHIEAALGSA